MSIMNDEVYDDDLHDEDDDEDDGEDDADDVMPSHGHQSNAALTGFTDRAMRHGRRAATWLLILMLVEGALVAGCCCVLPAVHSIWLKPGIVWSTAVVMLMVAVMIGHRWDRHRTKMANVIEDAMVWRSDAQQKEQDERDAMAQYDRDEAGDDKREALREELTWNVGTALVFIDAEGHRHPTAEQIAFEECQRREFDQLLDSVDDERDSDAESDDAPVVPAVHAWMKRWAGEKPVKQPRPAPLLKRHGDDEGRRLERELCRAINKHWDGAFHKLLDEGADPNGHNGSGRPLRIAVLRGRLEYVSWLLTLGADVNAQCYGRTIISILMSQVSDYIDEGDGEGDDFGWPEKLELIARWGADPHRMNKWYDEDDDSEGPNAWPFITRWPVLYEAFMKGHNAWLQADDDTMRVLRDAREAVELEEVASETHDMLRGARPM